jgi:hypothetical protein
MLYQAYCTRQMLVRTRAIFCSALHPLVIFMTAAVMTKWREEELYHDVMVQISRMSHTLELISIYVSNTLLS